MNYLLNRHVVSRRLQAIGVRAWVGDAVMKEEVLLTLKVRVVSVFMYKDAHRELYILFTVPNGRQVTEKQLCECRAHAVKWFSEWNAAPEPSFSPHDICDSVSRTRLAQRLGAKRIVGRRLSFTRGKSRTRLSVLHL
jgi:hypothetical protein